VGEFPIPIDLKAPGVAAGSSKGIGYASQLAGNLSEEGRGIGARTEEVHDVQFQAVDGILQAVQAVLLFVPF
jgi:hypothetical protein